MFRSALVKRPFGSGPNFPVSWQADFGRRLHAFEAPDWGVMDEKLSVEGE
jgi:hypothetical protein